MTESKSRDHGKVLGGVLGFALLILASPIILLWAVFRALSGVVLYIAIWLGWCSRGHDVLVVYSESPIWRDYIEKEILSKLEGRAVVLNWSRRKRWKISLAVLTFRHFGGRHSYNPLAVVFRPFCLPKVFRFYEPFQEFKHGKPAKVEQLKTELLKTLDVARRAKTAHQ
jgi:hypothetical protein